MLSWRLSLEPVHRRKDTQVERKDTRVKWINVSLCNTNLLEVPEKSGFQDPSTLFKVGAQCVPDLCRSGVSDVFLYASEVKCPPFTSTFDG